jgi:hypothetical protein
MPCQLLSGREALSEVGLSEVLGEACPSAAAILVSLICDDVSFARHRSIARRAET